MVQEAIVNFKKARTQHDVSKDLVVVHLDMSNGNTQAKDLLELELDRGAHLVDLVGKIFSVGDGGGEFAS